MKKMLSIASLALFTFAVSILAFIIIQLYPYKVVQINKLPYPVKTPVVKTGEYLILDADYCKFMALPSTYALQFIEQPSGKVVTIEERFSSNLDTGCHKVDFSVLVPESMTPGKYKVKILLRYKVNPWREVQYSFSSDPFEIVKSPTIREIMSVILEKL